MVLLSLGGIVIHHQNYHKITNNMKLQMITLLILNTLGRAQTNLAKLLLGKALLLKHASFC